MALACRNEDTSNVTLKLTSQDPGVEHGLKTHSLSIRLNVGESIALVATLLGLQQHHYIS